MKGETVAGVTFSLLSKLVDVPITQREIQAAREVALAMRTPPVFEFKASIEARSELEALDVLILYLNDLRKRRSEGVEAG